MPQVVSSNNNNTAVSLPPARPETPSLIIKGVEDYKINNSDNPSAYNVIAQAYALGYEVRTEVVNNNVGLRRYIISKSREGKDQPSFDLCHFYLNAKVDGNQAQVNLTIADMLYREMKKPALEILNPIHDVPLMPISASTSPLSWDIINTYKPRISIEYKGTHGNSDFPVNTYEVCIDQTKGNKQLGTVYLSSYCNDFVCERNALLLAACQEFAGNTERGQRLKFIKGATEDIPTISISSYALPQFFKLLHALEEKNKDTSVRLFFTGREGENLHFVVSNQKAEIARFQIPFEDYYISLEKRDRSMCKAILASLKDKQEITHFAGIVRNNEASISSLMNDNYLNASVEYKESVKYSLGQLPLKLLNEMEKAKVKIHLTQYLRQYEEAAGVAQDIPGRYHHDTKAIAVAEYVKLPKIGWIKSSMLSSTLYHEIGHFVDINMTSGALSNSAHFRKARELDVQDLPKFLKAQGRPTQALPLSAYYTENVSQQVSDQELFAQTFAYVCRGALTKVSTEESLIPTYFPHVLEVVQAAFAQRYGSSGLER